MSLVRLFCTTYFVQYHKNCTADKSSDKPNRMIDNLLMTRDDKKLA
ncbi:hypothetical protein AO372_1412 [Moraxella catarrhalis]|nr:hypothetical protein AO379_0630 [Moraxella catarrhalis]OAV08404.1 hypothetical protein AO380_0870 [Moraxella catarrhalis]OAV17703.1 hypothetical protein AO373_1513 [Moraxella catarrhalis]OAV20354.1 hypothetical protein AO372_1412 [Moraxella catarrhalis]OAV24686.1 hypothetical protein AO371_0915 [Moraxella catarrhalis]